MIKDSLHKKIYTDFDLLLEDVVAWKNANKKIVFTNGCFDIIHAGHVSYLEEASCLGDVLIVGLNSDASIKRLKGDARPIHLFRYRAIVLAGLRSVSAAIGFEDDTPIKLIQAISPDVLVKGGDWHIHDIVGAEHVLQCGGLVKSLPYLEGLSTSGVIETIMLNKARERGNCTLINEPILEL